MKKADKSSFAGTTDKKNTKDDSQHVSQACINAIVIGGFVKGNNL